MGRDAEGTWAGTDLGQRQSPLGPQLTAPKAHKVLPGGPDLGVLK